MDAFWSNKYGGYEQTETAAVLRASGGDIGGGSEVLVICSTHKRSEHCAMTITKESTASMLNKGS